MNRRDILNLIEDSVVHGDIKKMESLLQHFPDLEDMGTDDVLYALSQGMEKARLNIKDGFISIPELLLSIDTFRAGTAITGNMRKTDETNKGVVVIGVVEGDPHDLGKNIVAALFEAHRFDVHDLGKNVSADRFLDAVKEKKADILALSTMMSTPIEHMHQIIQWSRRLCRNTKIMVGGAAIDENIAGKIGADGYSETAVYAPDIAVNLLSESNVKSDFR